MFMDLWVASDGCTTIRFPDEQSALLYCAQTGWPSQDLLKVRTQISEINRAVEVEPWYRRMDPEADSENSGTWDSEVYVPPAKEETDLPDVLTKEFIGKLAFTSAVTGWEFRDLAASVEEMIDAAFEFANTANQENREVTWQEAMEYCFRKTGMRRTVD